MEPARDALIIRIAKTGENLGMSAFYSDGSADNTPYTEIPYAEKEIAALCGTIDSVLSKVHETAAPQSTSLQQLADAGQKLFETVFSLPIKECVRKSRVEFLVLSVDDELMRMPWELLHDRKEFLCLRFAVSRSVGVHEFKGAFYRPSARRLKAMVFAPTSAYIGMAYNEGIAVINEFYTKRGKVEASFEIMDVGLKFLNDNLEGHDIVHFVGQIAYDPFGSSKSGWVFSDGVFSADEIRSLGMSGRLPYFVFSDAYQYGPPEAWPLKNTFRREACDMAAAFLSSGTGHFIGTFWKIPDEARILFVKEFYSQALAGIPVGDALRLARMKLIQAYGRPSLVWATYALYGDPMMTIFETKIEFSRPAPAAGSGGGLLAMPAFGKIKLPVIVLAILVATFFADRLFNRTYVARQQPRVGREIGSGLKYLVSMKEAGKDVAEAIRGGDSVFRGQGAFNILWWRDVAFDELQRLRDKCSAKLMDAFGKALSPLTAESELARLYGDIFFTQDAVYLDMLARLSIKATLDFDGVTATVRPVKDKRARKLFVKAKIFLAGGNSEKALKVAQAALAITRIKDDRRDEATVLGFIGALYMENGFYKEAAVCMAENKNLMEAMRDTMGTADACFNLGLFAGRRSGIAGRIDIRYLDKALAAYRSVKDYNDAGGACLWLGYSYAARKEFDTAIRYLDAAAKMAANNNDASTQALAYKAYGDIYIGMKDYVSAENFYKQALAIVRLSEKEEDLLAYLDSLYRLVFLNAYWHDRVGEAKFFRQIVKFKDDPKVRRITAPYKNAYGMLGMLNSLSGEAVSKEAMRRLYTLMATSFFQMQNYKTANRLLDLALSYKTD
jgi:tetratricopeptide (TPR) repeat protein